MNSRTVNQAMLNRVSSQWEYKTLNNRIEAVNNRVNGVDVVFRPNSEITSAVLNSLLSGTGLDWLNAATINNATVYEAPAPSSYINNLAPSGMLKGTVKKDGVSYAETYSPLESFIRYDDGSVMFNPLQRSITENAKMNYGGNIQNAIMPLISNITPAVISTIKSNVAESEVLDLNNLYFIQNTDLIASNFNGAQAESFTLHFE